MSKELTIERIRELRAGAKAGGMPQLAFAFVGENWRVGYYDGGEWVTRARVSTWEGSYEMPEVYAELFARAPEAIDFLLAKLDEMRADSERLDFIEAHGFGFWLPRHSDKGLRETLDARRATLAQK